MGRVKRWFFRTFFSCIKKAKGKYSGTGSEHICPNPRIIRENITFVEDAWLPIPSSNFAVNMDIDDYRKHSNDSMNSTEEEEQEQRNGNESSSFNEGNHQQGIENGDRIPEQILDSEKEFSFWPWNDSKELDICIADKIFFQGRLLPMGISSGSAGNTPKTVHKNKPRPKVEELFQVPHQSRKAQIQFSKISRRLRFRNRHHKTAFWRFLRVGLMTMPEFRVHTSGFTPRTFW